MPPTVVVQAHYPGANPKVIAETVATPLEEQINGVEDMLYMFSQATSDGALTLTITFKLGTDPDMAQEQVQNRVNQALPRLPQESQRLGRDHRQELARPHAWSCICISPDGRYDMLYLRNYAVLQVKDQLAKTPRRRRRAALRRRRLLPCASGSTRRRSPTRGLTADDVVDADPRAERPGRRRRLGGRRYAMARTCSCRSTPRAA